MGEARHLKFVKRDLFVQSARFGGDCKPWGVYGPKLAEPGLSERVYEALQAAASNGHASIVKQLLMGCSQRNGININGQDFKVLKEAEINLLFFVLEATLYPSHKTWLFHGKDMVMSPLHQAVKEGHGEVVEELINFLQREGALLSNKEKGLEMRKRKEEATRKWFQGLIEWAVRWGHASIVKLLLTAPAPNKLLFPIKDVVLPLPLAAHLGQLDVLNVLLQLLPQTKLLASLSPDVGKAELKKSLSWFSEDGLTALHLAAQCGCLSALQLLMATAANLDVNSRSSPELFTPLHMAASCGHVEVVHFLLKKDGNPSARDCMGRTALHYAAREGHEAVAQVLLSCKAGIESSIASIPDYDGLLPLHMAAKGGHVEVIRTLRGQDELINSKSKHSLQMRTWVEGVYIRGRFMNHNNWYFGRKWRFPRPSVTDSFFWKTEGFTPLHFAARYGHESVINEELLQQGSNDVLLIKDSGGFSVSDWMEANKQADASRDHGSGIAYQESSPNNIPLTSNPRIPEMASHINDEKQCIAELRHAWATGNPNLPVRAPILQWLIQYDASADYSQSFPAHTNINNVDAFSALLESLRSGNFSVAKEILLLHPETTLDAQESKLVISALQGFSRATPLLMKGERGKSLVESFLLVLVKKDGLIGASSVLRRLFRWAKAKKLTRLVDVILDRPELKRGLYEDRQVYLDCANAILVGAVLIAGVAFQGWLQPPLGYEFQYEGESYAETNKRAMRLFWWFNNGAFFLAVGSLIAGAKGAVPVAKEMDIIESLAKVRRAVAVASVLMGAALVCVVGAFIAAGFATLPPLSNDRNIMYISVSWGATICGLCLLWFSLSVWPLLVQTCKYWFNPTRIGRKMARLFPRGRGGAHSP